MAMRTRLPISPMFGLLPATLLHAIRTGSWLAPEAPTNARGFKRYAAALSAIAVLLLQAPPAAYGLRLGHAPRKAHSAHLHVPDPRPLPYPQLAWPLEISGGQYAPVAWSD